MPAQRLGASQAILLQGRRQRQTCRKGRPLRRCGSEPDSAQKPASVPNDLSNPARKQRRGALAPRPRNTATKTNCRIRGCGLSERSPNPREDVHRISPARHGKDTLKAVPCLSLQGRPNRHEQHDYRDHPRADRHCWACLVLRVDSPTGYLHGDSAGIHDDHCTFEIDRPSRMNDGGVQRGNAARSRSTIAL